MQFTVVNGVASKLRPISYGVPQRSVLGPLLFILYINYICNISHDHQPRLFADDANLFIADKDPVRLNLICNEALSKINDWSLSNKLTLNITKTNFSIFAPSRQRLNAKFDLYIAGVKLQQTSCAKYLGIYIDDDLKWKTHITYVYKSIIKFTGIFYKLR